MPVAHMRENGYWLVLAILGYDALSMRPSFADGAIRGAVIAPTGGSS
jgi:hypothetical protein